MSGDAPPPHLSPFQQANLDPMVFGRRLYAGKAARGMLNDVSCAIAEQAPDYVENPTDPSLSDVIRHVARRGVDPEVKGMILVDLIQNGLTYREAVRWYWYQHAQLELSEIYYASNEFDKGGDPGQRADHIDDTVASLRTAAEKLDVDVTIDPEWG